jgi:hypothetical protein
MSLYLCVFDGDREADGVEVGPYADFNALRMAVAATAPGGAAESTFPTLLGHSDCDGAWSPEDCARLRAELETAETSLRARPPAPFPSPWQAEAARAAGLVPRDESECFVDVDGSPLLGRLRGLARTATRLGRPILFQ